MKATNINTELFKRYAPKKKLAIIEALTQTELLAITPATITRIVREVGDYKSKEYTGFRVRQEFRVHVIWDIYFIGIDLREDKLWAFFSHTDDNAPIKGTMYETCYMESIQSSCFHDDNVRAKVARSFLKEYVYKKYLDKSN